MLVDVYSKVYMPHGAGVVVWVRVVVDVEVEVDVVVEVLVTVVLV